MLRVKGADTLAPIGPGLVTDWDFHNKRIRTIVNGVVKQDSTTAEMEWDMHYLVADIARTITLVPGDILFSGTPAFSRTVYPGDVVTVEVEGLGSLTNVIVEGPTPIRTDVGAQPTESEEVISTAKGGDIQVFDPMGLDNNVENLPMSRQQVVAMYDVVMRAMLVAEQANKLCKAASQAFINEANNLRRRARIA